MKRRTPTVIGLALLGGAIVLVGGYWLLGELSSLFGANRVYASYPGMKLRGDADGWGWKYTVLEVTSPADADLSVQFDSGPSINIKDLTPALVEGHRNETRVGAVVDPRTVQIGCGGSQVFFRDGIVVRAQFAEDSKVRLSHDLKAFTMPISRGQFEAIFGKASSETRRRFCL